jgi:biotin transport system substrate-specific component
VSIPVPFTPVPMTLQPLAVLVVGGLLGASAGAAALTTYLAMGLLGLPVFAGALQGVPGGIPRLMGPTGGYLLSYPVVAAFTGALTTSALEAAGVARTLRVLMACALGMAIIHLGGTAQLAALTGSADGAFKMGFVPFFTGDLIKIGLAAAVILLAGPRVRSQL